MKYCTVEYCTIECGKAEYCTEEYCTVKYCIYITQLEIEWSGVEWEYWLIKPEAQGPEARGLRALLANIPTPLNFQLGNTGSISHLTSQNI